MQIVATPGEVVIRFGRRFGGHEAARVSETIAAFSPVTALTLDFSDIREFHDSAIAPLAAALGALRATVRVRGLTRHQSRMFTYFGLAA